MKLEKITLWTAIETYGFAKPEPGALDYIIYALQGEEVTVKNRKGIRTPNEKHRD